tara:strand:+ start:1950 stop:3317 length:1368 start_codon:yes stop_codon:yes gene_type:complete
MKSVNANYNDHLFIYLKYIQKYCFILLPFFLVTGPFFSDLSIVIIGSIYLLILIKEKIYKNNYYSTIIYIFSFFYLYLIICSLFSSNIFLSLESSLFYFRFIFFVFGSLYVLKNSNNALKFFSYVLLFVFILELIDGYIQFFFDQNILGFSTHHSRLSILFSDELILGSYLSRLFPLMFVLSLNLFNKSKLFVFFLSLIIILTDLLVYVSGERTAFFYLLIGIALLIFMSNKFKLLRILTFVISLSLIAFISLNNEKINDRMVSQTIEGFINQSNDLILDEENQNSSNSILDKKNLKGENFILDSKFNAFSPAHTKIYLSAINIYKDNNKIFGIGPKLFREYCTKDKYIETYTLISCSTHPHNSYIQLLVEIGLGVIIVILLFLYVSFIIIKHIYMSIFKNKKILTDIEVGSFICLFITLWPLAPSGSFFNNWLNIIYYIPLIFVLYERGKKTND